MQDGVVGDHGVNLISFRISHLKTTVTCPKLASDDLASSVDKPCTTAWTNSPFLALIDIRPALFASRNKRSITLRRLFWDLLFGNFLTILLLNVNDFTSAQRTLFWEFPEFTSALRAAKTMLTVEFDIFGGYFIETDWTDLGLMDGLGHDGLGSFCSCLDWTGFGIMHIFALFGDFLWSKALLFHGRSGRLISEVNIITGR